MADISTGDIYMEKVEFKEPRLIISGHKNINHSLSKINDYIKRMLKSWIAQYNEHYLAGQRFFYPYPEKLRSMKKI